MCEQNCKISSIEFVHEDINPKTAKLSFLNKIDAMISAKSFQNLTIKGNIISTEFEDEINNSSISRANQNEIRENVKEIFIKIHSDPIIKKIIDKLSILVSENGFEFEDEIIQRERKNRYFNFLYNENSNDYFYYKWKVFSIIEGKTWPNNQVQIFKNGPRYNISELIEELDDDQIISRKSKAGHTLLTNDEKEYWERLLDNLDVTRFYNQNLYNKCNGICFRSL